MAKSSVDDDDELRRACEAEIERTKDKILMSFRVAKSSGIYGKNWQIGSQSHGQASDWVNRLAHAGDTAAEIAGNTAYRLRQARTEIIAASKVAYRFLAGVASNNSIATPGSPVNSPRGSLRFQATWFKNLTSSGSKPSTTSELESWDEEVMTDEGA
ncbi:unnamed protein product [Fraxinus pennsylvanica]|uniref:Uncharacterized protein n=1 Tax=Fraxinus pennsylvanica TaxID=56036 RepID=A0AAD2DVP0_9LAMI|nr:unnamed protein product [Fraxinus pennsylvanica]